MNNKQLKVASWGLKGQINGWKHTKSRFQGLICGVICGFDLKTSLEVLEYTLLFVRMSIFRVEPAPFLFYGKFHPGNVLSLMF